MNGKTAIFSKSDASFVTLVSYRYGQLSNLPAQLPKLSGLYPESFARHALPDESLTTIPRLLIEAFFGTGSAANANVLMVKKETRARVNSLLIVMSLTSIVIPRLLQNPNVAM
ncbi:MAG: phosphotransferase system glucose/maltose/N-acetylglucosamine-specific IIC component [Paracoccaceae bacterium]